MKRCERVRTDAERVVRGVLTCARPESLVADAWPQIEEAIARDGGQREGGCDVVAFGKASLGMAAEVATRLGQRLRHGIVLAPAGRGDEADRLRRSCERQGERVGVLMVDHPLATERNVYAAEQVERLLRDMRARGDTGATLVVLISGGGSAHLTLPAEGVTLDAIGAVSGRLMRAGADIAELNTVRKHLERLKGGRLAALASGYQRVVSVVISDVVGDDLSVIASGPLAADPSNYAEAIGVLERLGIGREAAPIVWSHLERGAAGEIDETPKPGDAAFGRVRQWIAGSNAIALEAACEVVRSMGFDVAAVMQGVTGEASTQAGLLVDAATHTASRGDGGMALVWGGETTVTVGEGAGVGGRNQEFVLAAARRIRESAERERIGILSFATDGVDGPTDAAGAVASGATWDEMLRARVDPVLAMERHDSHAALDRVGALIRTGPTGTNVNDVMVALIYPEEGER